MTQIDKIKAEIERLINLFPKPHGEILLIDQNAYNLISDLKRLIDTLPVEQPSEELDIDEELKKFFENNNLYVDVNDSQTVRHYNGASTDKRYYYEDIARHFAQWQKEIVIEKACEWLKRCVDVDDEVKMIDGEPEVESFIQKARHRTEVANQIVGDFKKAMEEI